MKKNILHLNPVRFILLAVVTLFALQVPQSRAANFVMNLTDAAGASSFNTGLHWTGGAVPAIGNTYQTVNFLLRTPANATSLAFLGDSLEVQAGGTLRDKTAAIITVTNLILANTAIVELTQPNGVNTAAAAGTLAGGIALNGTATFHAGINTDVAGETFTISSTISGTGGITTSGSNGKIIFTGVGSYSGGLALAGLANSTVQLGNANAVSNSVVTIGLANGLLFSSGIGTFSLGGLAGASNEALADTAAAAVTLNIGGNNSSSTYSGLLSGAGGLVKSGTGIQTLSNTNTYTGTTAINGGKLAITSGARTTNSFTVADGATLGVTVSGTNQLSVSSLTLGSSTGATNEFLGVTSSTITPVKPATLTLNGTTTINIISGNFVGGTSYPLIEYATLAGAGTYVLGSLPSGVSGNLSTSGNIIYLNVTSVAASIWTGAINNLWDIGATANWTVSGSSSIYSDGVIVQFNNAGANPNISIPATVSPASTTVSNSATSYSFSGSAISGIGGLTKIGNGTLTLNNLNIYSGNTVVSNGTINLGVDNAIPGGSGKGDVNLAGGTLNLNAFNQTLNGLSGSGTVDTVAGGAPTLTVGSNDVSSVFTGLTKNSAGALAVTKTGAGTFVLGGTTTYTGSTTIAGGTLVVASTSGQTPFFMTNANTTLRFASNYFSAQGINLPTNTTSVPETILVDAGAEAVVQGLNGGNGGTGNVWFSGGGALRLTNSISTYSSKFRLNYLTFIIDNNAIFTNLNPSIESQIGSGITPNQPTNAAGTMTVRGNGQYIQPTQGLRLGSDGNGSTGILNVQDTAVVSTPLIYIPRQGGNTGIVNQANGTVTVGSIQGGAGVGGTNWLGVYNLNGGTLAWGGVFGGAPTAPSMIMLLNLNGGLLQLTGSASIGGWTAINVFSNNAVVDTMANAVTFNDAFLAGDAFNGSLIKLGSGTLTLGGTNTYSGNTVVSNGVLALSLPAGGTSSLSNSPTIRLEPTATLDVSGIANGFQVVNGQTLRGNGFVSGPTTVNAGGTLTIGGATGTPGTLTFNNNLTLTGNTTLRLNKSATSDLLTGIGTLQAGGTLNLANVGPALANGDSFTLFSATTVNGTFAISPLTPGAGLAWDQSQLSSGIIKVGLAPAAPTISPALQNQTVECGGNATFTAVAIGTQPLYFQWSTNGTPVSGWTTNDPNVFTLTNVHSAGSVYTVSVIVTNSFGSTNSSATLTVQDTTAPLITMFGSNPMNVLAQSTFVDPGAIALDGCEGTVAVATNGTVDTSVLGTYTLTYSATDSTGNPASVSRTVNVILANSAWTNVNSGLWSVAANWLNGAIPNNNITVADFSTIDVTNDVNVSLDSSRKVAGLAFGDTTNATAAGWTINNNGNSANVLTLEEFDGGMPGVAVGALGAGKVATISARIAGTNGIVKSGTGTLVLSGPNTYVGTTMVANGTLVVGGSFTNISGDLALTNSNTTLRFSSNAIYNLAQGLTISDNTANGAETVLVDSNTVVMFHGINAGNGGGTDTWFGGGGTLLMTNGSSTYAGRLRLNNLTLIIDNNAVLTQNSGVVSASQIGSGIVPNQPANSTGVMTVRGNGQYIQTSQGLRLGSDGNGGTGILNVQGNGSVNVPLLYIPRQSGNSGIVNQSGGTVTTATIAGGGAGTWDGTYNLNGGTLSWGGTFATGPTAAGQTMNLNLNGGILQFTAPATVAGWSAINVKANRAIIDTMANAVTFTDPLVAGDAFNGGLTKIGFGTLLLSGANTYTGSTKVNEGILELTLPTLPATASVAISNSAMLQLDFAETNSIGSLVFNGVTQSPGVYNSVNGAPYLTGTGSLLVPAAVAGYPTNISFSVSGNTLGISWPATHLGWILQSQTNSLSIGLKTNWVDVAGSSAITQTNITINPAMPTMFFRLRNP